jgi:hypothetical protein
LDEGTLLISVIGDPMLPMLAELPELKAFADKPQGPPASPRVVVEAQFAQCPVVGALGVIVGKFTSVELTATW